MINILIIFFTQYSKGKKMIFWVKISTINQKI
jgi:hypothetical protein